MVILSEVKCDSDWLPCSCKILAETVSPFLLEFDVI